MTKQIKQKSASSADFLIKVKSVLRSEKERLEKDLLKFAKKNPMAPGGFDSSFPDYGDKDDENAAEVADYVVNLSLEDNLEKALRDVNQALERLAKGKYGICKYCSKPIEDKRLLIRPSSSACMVCKKTIKQEL